MSKPLTGNMFAGVMIATLLLIVVIVAPRHIGATAVNVFMALGGLSALAWIADLSKRVSLKGWGEVAKGYALIWALPAVLYVYLLIRFRVD
jgi:hypothetical protein